MGKTTHTDTIASCCYLTRDLVSLTELWWVIECLMTLSPTICVDPRQLFCIWPPVTAVDTECYLGWILGGGVHSMTWAADMCHLKLGRHNCNKAGWGRQQYRSRRQHLGSSNNCWWGAGSQGWRAVADILEARRVCWVETAPRPHTRSSN